jgi:hypothetical protein
MKINSAQMKAIMFALLGIILGVTFTEAIYSSGDYSNKEGLFFSSALILGLIIYMLKVFRNYFDITGRDEKNCAATPSNTQKMNHEGAHDLIAILRKHGLFMHGVNVDTEENLAAELVEKEVLSKEDAIQISSFVVQLYYAPESSVTRSADDQRKLISTDKSAK